MSTCPFCGHHPYEYVDVGVGGDGVPVAVNCCHLGHLIFDWRTEKALHDVAQKAADELGDMPFGEDRLAKAELLIDAAIASAGVSVGPGAGQAQETNNKTPSPSSFPREET